MNLVSLRGSLSFVIFVWQQHIWIWRDPDWPRPSLLPSIGRWIAPQLHFPPGLTLVTVHGYVEHDGADQNSFILGFSSLTKFVRRFTQRGRISISDHLRPKEGELLNALNFFIINLLTQFPDVLMILVFCMFRKRPNIEHSCFIPFIISSGTSSVSQRRVVSWEYQMLLMLRPPIFSPIWVFEIKLIISTLWLDRKLLWNMMDAVLSYTNKVVTENMCANI